VKVLRCWLGDIKTRDCGRETPKEGEAIRSIFHPEVEEKEEEEGGKEGGDVGELKGDEGERGVRGEREGEGGGEEEQGTGNEVEVNEAVMGGDEVGDGNVDFDFAFEKLRKEREWGERLCALSNFFWEAIEVKFSLGARETTS